MKAIQLLDMKATIRIGRLPVFPVSTGVIGPIGILPVLLFLTLFAPAGYSLQPPVKEPGPQADVIAPGVPLEKLTVEELIDRLQGEGGDWFSPSGSGFGTDFLGRDLEPPVDGGAFCSGKPRKTPVLWELVRRGLSSLPKLLDHLEDRRPTKWTVRTQATERPWRFGNLIVEEIRKRPFVCVPAQAREVVPCYGQIREHAFTEEATVAIANAVKEDWYYTLKVGDLCYVAVGQIVNRPLIPVHLHDNGWVHFSSPVLFPDLAKSCREEWSNLTADKHKQSLLDDCINPWGHHGDVNGISRLYFYFPKEGERLILDSVKKLNRARKPLSAFLESRRLLLDHMDKNRVFEARACIEDLANLSREVLEFSVEQGIIDDRPGRFLLLAGQRFKSCLIDLVLGCLVSIPTDQEIANAVKECEKQMGKEIALLIPVVIESASESINEGDYLSQASAVKSRKIQKRGVLGKKSNEPGTYPFERVASWGGEDMALSLPDFRSKKIDLTILELLKRIPGFGPRSGTDLEFARRCARTLAGRMGEPELREYLVQRIEQAKKDPSLNAFGYDLPIYNELLNSLKIDLPEKKVP